LKVIIKIVTGASREELSLSSFHVETELANLKRNGSWSGVDYPTDRYSNVTVQFEGRHLVFKGRISR